MPVPQTRYTKSGDVNVAYQVLGDGPIDLVLVWGWLSHLDFQWTEPTVTGFLRRLASFSRLIMFDKRGTGLSDPVAGAPAFEERMDDIRAVMDANGSERAALLGFSEGTAMASLFAAAHPERITSLILYDGFAAGPAAEGADADPAWVETAATISASLRHWGEGTTVDWAAPSLAEVPTIRRFWGALERASMSPGAAASLWGAIETMDIRDVLPTIAVPTLVLHHAESPLPPSGGKRMADLIPGARYLELPGRDHMPGAGDPEAIAGEIEEFLTGAREAEEPDRILATILFTDIVDSTRRAGELGDSVWRQLLERHNALVREQIRRFRGREVKQTGDGFLASFDGPARGIRCARSIIEEAREIGIEVRTGLHTGECELIGDDLGGMAVHVAARVGSQADAGEVLVSGTVKDLVMGSGIDFADRGSHQLKGVPGDWLLFGVAVSSPQPSGTPAGSTPVPRERPSIGDRATQRMVRSAPGLARAGAWAMQRRSGS